MGIFFTTKSFHQKLEKIQDNAFIAITGAIRGTWREKIYQEFDLESFENRHWFFFKIFKNKSPDYMYIIAPKRRSSCITRNSEEIPLFNAKLLQKFVFVEYYYSME